MIFLARFSTFVLKKNQCIKHDQLNLSEQTDVTTGRTLVVSTHLKASIIYYLTIYIRYYPIVYS